MPRMRNCASNRVRRRPSLHGFALPTSRAAAKIDKEDVVMSRDTSIYNHFQTRSNNERRLWQDDYWPVAQRSKYVLYARGAGTSGKFGCSI